MEKKKKETPRRRTSRGNDKKMFLKNVKQNRGMETKTRSFSHFFPFYPQIIGRVQTPA